MSRLAYAVVWVFVFTLPWQSTVVVIPGTGAISKATGILALGAAIGLAVLRGRFRKWQLFHIAGLLFVLWLVILLLVLHSSGDLPNTFWTFVQLFIVLWIVWELAPSWERALGLFTAYVFGAHIAALDTIWTFRHAKAALQRYTAGGVDANDLAMTLVLALPMAWYLGMTYRRPLLKWICRAYLPVGLLAVGLTGSRGGMIAASVALLIVPATLTRLSPKQRMAAIVLIVLGCGVAVVYVPSQVVERLSTITTQVEGGSLSGRGKIWKAGFQAFMARPVVGYGPGGFREAVYPYLGLETQVAHNSYLSVLVEDGLIGFLFYATMVGAAWLAALRLPLLERRFTLVLLAALAVAMLPLSWESRKPVWFILATVVALAHAPRPWTALGVPEAAPVLPRRRAAVPRRVSARPGLGR
jgi:O-antigen ligase